MGIFVGVMSLLCGVALFLFGMSIMGDGLKKIAGEKMEGILNKLSGTKFRAMSLGTLVTTVIQSSSATTIMIIGFVNSGMMKVSRAIPAIMGATIGTSVTGWILCLSSIEGGSGIAALISTKTIASVTAVVGIILYLFSKKESKKRIGEVLMGFTILMVGMQAMSGAVAPLRDVPEFRDFLKVISNPIIGILFGIVFTAVLQSASAAIGVLQAISVTGALTFASAFPVALGIGIGASTPVLLSAIGATIAGRRTAFSYLVNETLGMIINGTIFYTANAIMGGFEIMNMVMFPAAIAMINSSYRIITVTVLFNFVKYIEKLLEFLIKPKYKDEKKAIDFALIDDRFLNIPLVAIENSYIVSQRMIKHAWKSVQSASELTMGYDAAKMDKAYAQIADVAEYHNKLSKFLTKLTGKNLTEDENKYVTVLFHDIHEFKKISDSVAKALEKLKTIIEGNIVYSQEDVQAIANINNHMAEIFMYTMDCYSHNDINKATKVKELNYKLINSIRDAKNDYLLRNKAHSMNFKALLAYNGILDESESIISSCDYIASKVIKHYA